MSPEGQNRFSEVTHLNQSLKNSRKCQTHTTFSKLVSNSTLVQVSAPLVSPGAEGPGPSEGSKCCAGPSPPGCLLWQPHQEGSPGARGASRGAGRLPGRRRSPDTCERPVLPQEHMPRVCRTDAGGQGRALPPSPLLSNPSHPGHMIPGGREGPTSLSVPQNFPRGHAGLSSRANTACRQPLTKVVSSLHKETRGSLGQSILSRSYEWGC